MLTISTTHTPATDLGFLLHKHPAHLHEVDLSFGKAVVFYPVATEDRCTAALLVDIDPVGLVRDRKQGGDGFALAEYVSDRPYVASSFLSVALGRVFGTALAGNCAKRPELVQAAIPLEARLSPLPCRAGDGFLRGLFEPLGYDVEVVGHELDARFPEWGHSPFYTVTLKATCRLRDLLAHLYVLVPVLDDDKHYWVGEAEVEKLLRRGEGWLAGHPMKEQIARRYLKRRGGLVKRALAQLVVEEEPELEAAETTKQKEEAELEKPLSLNEQRLQAVVAAVKGSGAARVLDLGCGEGRLVRRLLDDRQFTEIVGVEVSSRALEVAHRRLDPDRMPSRQRERVKLLQGSLTYRDARFAGFDAATLVEVIEHVDADRLSALERVVFQHAQPRTVVVTTPNREYNALFANLPAGHVRHRDHRFEWTRAEFSDWAAGVAGRHGYTVDLQGIGPIHERYGTPTQMAVFQR